MFWLLFASPAGILFLYLWEGHAAVLCGMQVVGAVFLWLIYRAGIHSAEKNFSPRLNLGKTVYLPLWFQLFFYFAAGIPLILIFARNFTVLFWLYIASLLGFTLACLSGIAYVIRSGPVTAPGGPTPS